MKLNREMQSQLLLGASFLIALSVGWMPMGHSRLPTKGLQQRQRGRPQQSSRARRPLIALTGGATGLEIFTNTVAPTLGVVIANALFLSSVPAVLSARRTGNLGELNPVPWAFIFANCAAWLHYSYVIANPYAFFSNALGALLGLFYTLTAMSYGTPAQRATVEKVCIGFSVVTVVASFFSCFVLKTVEARQILAGYLANIILVTFYGAPLSTLKTVLQTKSAASIYGPLSALNAINGALWTAYGLGVGDIFITLPNAAGFVLGVVQLGFKAAF